MPSDSPPLSRFELTLIRILAGRILRHSGLEHRGRLPTVQPSQNDPNVSSDRRRHVPRFERA
jgi:hypothetical protein